MGKKKRIKVHFTCICLYALTEKKKTKKKRSLCRRDDSTMTPEFFSQFILYGTLTSATRVGTGLEAAKSQTFPGGRGELITEVSLFLPLQLKKKKKYYKGDWRAESNEKSLYFHFHMTCILKTNLDFCCQI